MKKLFFILFVIAFSLGNALLAQQTFPERANQKFRQLFDQFPQEKVFLHLDKTTYSTHETIWLKAYLTDATYHVPNLLSKYIYVELINRQDSICQRIKLRQNDSCFYGNIRLTPDLEPGDYCVRAYTFWMQNQDEAFFFKKNITILNSGSNVNIHTTNRKQDQTIQTILTLVNGSGTPYENQRLRVNLRRNTRTLKKTTVRTNEKGQTTLIYPASDSINNLIISFADDLPFRFSQSIYPPELSNDFDLQFFPEGGNLLTGTTQKLAFKAIRENGSSVEVKGQIYNSRNQAVASFSSSHRGMGTLSLNVQPNENYYALASTPQGLQKKINLPSPIPTGYALRAEWQADSTLQVSILKNSHTTSSRPLYLIVHTRGQLVNVIPVEADFVGSIQPAQLSPGICHFVLADDRGNVHSERLCFIAPEYAATNLQLQTDKPGYDRRELVKLTLQLPSADTLYPSGNFSVSVTDDHMVRKDSLSANIVSYFLLTSDLKGYIEAPDSYLREAPEITDLLMLTHGWTRFDVKQILTKNIPATPYALELNQQLHGQVTTLSEKPVINGKLQIFVPAQQLIGEVKTDEKGRFSIRSVEFRDSTLFLIRGYKEKGGKHVLITMDSLCPHPPHTYFPPLASASEEEKVDEFLDRFKGTYYYQDGVKIYVLDEVNVIRHRRPSQLQKYAGAYTDMTDQILGQKELSKFSASSIFHLIMRLPGVYVTGEKVSIRGGGTPLFLVDGTPTEQDYINGINPDDVDNIGVIKDGARLSFFGSNGGNGAIVINTRHGVGGIRPTPGLIKYYPLGYQQPDEFYMPAYQHPEEKNKPEIDYRSTIYWHPNIKTDANGKAEAEFYTADLPSVYTITVQGMTGDGKTYYSQKSIRRE